MGDRLEVIEAGFRRFSWTKADSSMIVNEALDYNLQVSVLISSYFGHDVLLRNLCSSQFEPSLVHSCHCGRHVEHCLSMEMRHSSC